MDRLSHGGIVAARILIAVVFVLNGLGIVDQTIPAKEIDGTGRARQFGPSDNAGCSRVGTCRWVRARFGRFPSLDGARTFRRSSSRNIHITFGLASCRYAGLPRSTDQLPEKYSHLGWSSVHCRVGRATMCAAAEDGHKRGFWCKRGRIRR